MKHKRAPPPPRNISLHQNQTNASRTPRINASPSTGEDKEGCHDCTDNFFYYSLAINFILIMGIVV
jgi:hypothetical protein